MAFSESELNHAVGVIAETVFTPASWDTALTLMAQAADAEFGQLLATKGGTDVQFNFASHISEDVNSEFVARGGGNPRINPRARIFGRPHYEINTDRTLASCHELGRSEFLNDFAYRIGSADVCSVILPSVSGLTLCAAVSRSRRHKEFDASSMAAFRKMLPHIQSAVELRATLANNEFAVATDMLDAMSAAVLVVDSDQRVLTSTRCGQDMLRRANFVWVRQRRLQALDRVSDTALQTALRLACSLQRPAHDAKQTRVNIRAANGDIAVATVAPLPAKRFDMRFGAAAIVAFNGFSSRADSIPILMELFGLTLAEANIADALFNGDSTAKIGAARGTSMATVLTQIKSILAKTGCQSRIELVQKLNSILR